MDEQHPAGSDGNGSAAKDIEDCIASFEGGVICNQCKAQITGNEFNCGSCGEYIGFNN